MDALQETQGQLTAFRAELTRSNPELYRHLALYLQVLRDGLLDAMQQACFRLATQVHPDRYCQIPAARRREFHARVADLSRRARSLLTVEQVAAMAAQIARTDQRQRREREAALLQRLQQGQNGGERGSDHDPEPDHPEEPGSIHLGLRPPIGHDSFKTAPSEPQAPPAEPPAPAEPQAEDDGPGLQRVLQAMAEALQTGPEQEQPEELQDARPPSAPWDGPCLPDDPLLLLAWLEGFEGALARRLRNLSHALNVDCLRLGLTQGLLPVGLLDAALQGQVDLLPAPPNLLRLQIPAGTLSAEGPLALVAVLLRLSDLELENPRLRTCRQRLQQHGQGINRMAQTYRRVQRRLQTLEAERLWLEDNLSGGSGASPMDIQDRPTELPDPRQPPRG